MKRAKNLYLVDGKPKTGTFYGTGRYIGDGKNTYQLFSRGRGKFHVDIPIGANDIGIIEKGYFVRCFQAHPNTLDFIQNAARVDDIIKRDKRDLEKNAQGLIDQWKNRRGHNE